MSTVKKFANGSFLETFSDVTNNPDESLRLEAHLTALSEASTAAQKKVRASKIDWKGKLEDLMELNDGLVKTGKITAANDSDLSRYVAARYLHDGQALKWQTLRTCLIRSRQK